MGSLAPGFVGLLLQMMTCSSVSSQALDDKGVKQINGKMTESLNLNNVRFFFLRVEEEEDGTFQVYCKSSHELELSGFRPIC